VLGIVDTVRVLNESARALFYQQRLDEREKAMAAELETLAKSLPRKELEARRERALAELQELKSDMERQLNEEIRATVARVASQRGLAGVLVRGPAVYWVPGAVVDITDEIITALK
jgi:Skp family chaperone for outer membrane proteins